MKERNTNLSRAVKLVFSLLPSAPQAQNVSESHWKFPTLRLHTFLFLKTNILKLDIDIQ